MPLDAFRNTFAGNPLDRASDRRRNPGWIAEHVAQRSARVLALCEGAPQVDVAGANPQLAYAPAARLDALPELDERLLFLGLNGADPVFAIDLDRGADPFADEGGFMPLRVAAALLAPDEAAIAATARGVFEWRRRHRHCSVCGVASLVADAGWRRVCPACRAEHFPRTDPVVIMLPVRGERCLLGRQARFPPGMHSALAGFLEPGESIEEACARELAEEAGLVTLAVRYHSSQPWPFPNSLMIGLFAEVADGEARADEVELEAVRWFTRAEARRLTSGETVDGCSVPPPEAIARQLIKAWSEA